MVTDRPPGLCDWGSSFFKPTFFWLAAPPKNNSRAIMRKKSLVKYRSSGSPRFWLVEMSYTQWCYYLKMWPCLKRASMWQINKMTDKSSHGLKILVYLVNTLWINVSPHSSFHSEQAAFLFCSVVLRHLLCVSFLLLACNCAVLLCFTEHPEYWAKEGNRAVGVSFHNSVHLKPESCHPKKQNLSIHFHWHSNL